MSTKKVPTFCTDDTLTLNSCCGVMEVGDFNYDDDEWCSGEPITNIPNKGTGMFVSTFVKGDRDHNKVRSVMKKTYDCLYQSTARTNHGPYAGRDPKTGEKNKIILCIFKHKEVK